MDANNKAIPQTKEDDTDHQIDKKTSVAQEFNADNILIELNNYKNQLQSLPKDVAVEGIFNILEETSNFVNYTNKLFALNLHQSQERLSPENPLNQIGGLIQHDASHVFLNTSNYLNSYMLDIEMDQVTDPISTQRCIKAIERLEKFIQIYDDFSQERYLTEESPYTLQDIIDTLDTEFFVLTEKKDRIPAEITIMNDIQIKDFKQFFIIRTLLHNAIKAWATTITIDSSVIPSNNQDIPNLVEVRISDNAIHPETNSVIWPKKDISETFEKYTEGFDNPNAVTKTNKGGLKLAGYLLGQDAGKVKLPKNTELISFEDGFQVKSIILRFPTYSR